MTSLLMTSRPRATRLATPESVAPELVASELRYAPEPPAGCTRSEVLSAFNDDRAIAAAQPWEDVVPGCGQAASRSQAVSFG